MLETYIMFTFNVQQVRRIIWIFSIVAASAAAMLSILLLVVAVVVAHENVHCSQCSRLLFCLFLCRWLLYVCRIIVVSFSSYLLFYIIFFFLYSFCNSAIEKYSTTTPSLSLSSSSSVRNGIENTVTHISHRLRAPTSFGDRKVSTSWAMEAAKSNTTQPVIQIHNL